jgi:citrate lyase alpha subunit
VMAEIAALGLRDIKIAASSLFPVHAPLIEHIRNGVVTGISASVGSCSGSSCAGMACHARGHAQPRRARASH